jgi:hypothetical protein
MVLGAIKKLVVLAAVAVASVSATPNAPYLDEHGILQVGTTELLNITAHAGANNEHTITYPDASYISVKFENVDLPEGDVLIVRSPDSTDGYVYTGKGRGDLGTFVSSPVRGTTAIVEYYALNQATPSSKVSYKIGGYVRGFNSAFESICGSDQSRPARCYTGSTAYVRSQAVARLLITGSALCTGWLIGSSGHLMTNQHCVTTAAAAAQIDVEFGAEATLCSDLCAAQFGCRGTIAARSATFVTNNDAIDYALIKLPESVASTYGYLQFRASGPRVGERIYIPQHPAGWAKRIASTVDGGAAATITFTDRDNTGCGNRQVGYLADTQGGSSGSPVLSQTDNLVVALHHCGGCNNLAVDPRTILNDLRSKGISVPAISK